MIEDTRQEDPVQKGEGAAERPGEEFPVVGYREVDIGDQSGAATDNQDEPPADGGN